MSSKALLATTALILALSAVSCGKTDEESSVSVAYGEASRTTVTEEAEEEKTTIKTTATTTATTKAESDTETTTEVTETELTETTTETSENDTATTTTSAPIATIPMTVSGVPVATVPENNTPAPEENNDNNNDDNNNDDTQHEEPPVNQEPEPTTEEPTEDNTFDFKFTVDNLLNDASGLLATLGTPDYSGEAPGCTSNGNDVKIYQYDGLEIQCYIDGATEYIFSIEITSDKYITDRDIKTGCTRAEVESAYGVGETSGNMTIYYTGNNEMDIEYNDDTVTSIFFYAPV